MLASGLITPFASAASSSDGGLGEETVQMDRYRVSSESESQRYGVAAAASTLKSSVSLLETPQNIQVVPRALLADQGGHTLQDALRNVAGVMPGGYYANWDYYRIRGFDAAFNTYIDGLRGGNGMSEETFGLEQVEIIKGPASSLLGQGPLGGVVNLVSKRPQRDSFVELGYTAGSFEYSEAILDANVSLDTRKTLLARLALVQRDQNSFVDIAGSKRLYAAPSFTWRIAENTTLTLLGHYSDYHIKHAMPLPAAGTVLPNPNGPIPHNRYNGEPDSNEGDEYNVAGGYELYHKFNDTFSLRQNLRYDYYEQLWTHMLYPSYLGEDQKTEYRYPYEYWQSWHDFTVDSRLEANFTTNSVKQQIVTGIDLYKKEYQATGQTIDFADPSAYMPIDLYKPQYGLAQYPALAPAFDSSESGRITGIYLHDHVSLPQNVTLTAGGRYDFSENTGVKAEKFTPRVGATWQFRPGFVLYGNSSESFNPQGSWQATAAGTPVKPETGENIEAGVKTSGADGRLTATVAVYQLTRKNVATADPLDPTYFTVTGEQRSRGFEFDGRFAPTRGWEVVASYSYTDAVITDDNTLPVGDRTQNVPRHSVNLWTKYTIQRGAFKGLGVGLGGRYYSDQAGDLPNTFKLPAYALVDAALYYTYKNIRAQVNINNAFDRSYYSGSYDTLYVLPGDPRTIQGSLTLKF